LFAGVDREQIFAVTAIVAPSSRRLKYLMTWPAGVDREQIITAIARDLPRARYR
jgi:hypothetical protein